MLCNASKEISGVDDQEGIRTRQGIVKRKGRLALECYGSDESDREFATSAGLRV